MSNYAKGHVPHRIHTQMDKVEHFAATIGMSGSATALSCSLVYSTERHCTVSGTSPGIVYLAFPSGYDLGRMISMNATLTAGSTSSLDFGGRNEATKAHYVLEPLGYVYPNGSPLATGNTAETGLYANPQTSTDPNAAGYDGGAYFKFQIKQLVQATGSYAGAAPVSATLADPVDASVASGWPTAKINVNATFRTRLRDTY